MYRLALRILALSLPLAACTPPEEQDPVELQPGLYEVVVGGGTLIESRSGNTVDRVCLDPAQAASFPTDPLDPLVKPWNSCSTELDEPKGNAMSGSRKCKARRMPMTATYSGSHTMDSFAIDGLVEQGSGEGGGVMHLGSGEFHITGKRVGDCQP
jgi:hypothetical protein